MKYKQYDVVYHKPEWHPNCGGHKVVEAVKDMGLYKMPHYKTDSKETKSGFVWMREWMLL